MLNRKPSLKDKLRVQWEEQRAREELEELRGAEDKPVSKKVVRKYKSKKRNS